VNAGKIPVTAMPGACCFDQATSFAMMRGGHLDVCVLGAFQVSFSGDLANWRTRNPDDIPAVGGAMDLAMGAKRVYVIMDLFSRQSVAKLVPRCTYPLTGVECVDRGLHQPRCLRHRPERRPCPRDLRHHRIRTH
jgi:3-oxoadipate CoA-transferase, beta subunit